MHIKVSCMAHPIRGLSWVVSPQEWNLYNVYRRIQPHIQSRIKDHHCRHLMLKSSAGYISAACACPSIWEKRAVRAHSPDSRFARAIFWWWYPSRKPSPSRCTIQRPIPSLSSMPTTMLALLFLCHRWRTSESWKKVGRALRV